MAVFEKEYLAAQGHPWKRMTSLTKLKELVGNVEKVQKELKNEKGQLKWEETISQHGLRKYSSRTYQGGPHRHALRQSAVPRGSAITRQQKVSWRICNNSSGPPQRVADQLF